MKSETAAGALRAGGKRRRRCALPAHSIRLYYSLTAFGSLEGDTPKITRTGYMQIPILPVK